MKIYIEIPDHGMLNCEAFDGGITKGGKSDWLACHQ